MHAALIFCVCRGSGRYCAFELHWHGLGQGSEIVDGHGAVLHGDLEAMVLGLDVADLAPAVSEYPVLIWHYGLSFDHVNLLDMSDLTTAHRQRHCH